ncbi:MAG: DUF554 domain-containing protein [Bacteroidales bacterium]|nr:DUF554 domain-containing protein [Bacteroidales bacterium]MCF8458361.1 DUF554 domain-containing protein [Bacteroidales bacterium]
MTGTLINAAAIIVGGSIGMLLHSRLPERFSKIVFQGLGLFTLFLGASMALKTNEFLIMVFSILIGSVAGEAMRLEEWVHGFSEKIKNKFSLKGGRFTEGLVTAFLLFCVGSMTILGAIEEGLDDEPKLLLAKSVMDGFSSIALAAAMGIGVIFSIVPLIIYQGGLTLAASWAGNYFDIAVINELSAVGGILLLGLGLKILEIKNIKVINMLPSLVIVVILAWLFIDK